jgi:hypothetical protein
MLAAFRPERNVTANASTARDTNDGPEDRWGTPLAEILPLVDVFLPTEGEHDTTYVDANTLTVAVGAAEVNAAATLSVTCRNPGSGDYNAISVTIH